MAPPEAGAAQPRPGPWRAAHPEAGCSLAWGRGAASGAVGLGSLATRPAASGSGPPLAHGCRAPLVTPSGALLCGRVAVCSSIYWPMTLGRFQVVDTENEAAISVCKQVFAQTSFRLALSPG